MVRFVTPLVLASLSVTALAAQSCSSSSQCKDETYPCCSQYGECGTGAYCLGGCDPLASFSLDSCAPMPVCESKTYTWDNLDNAVTQDKYLGNATEYDWTYSGKPKTEDGNLIMTMPAKSVGTLFANNHYIWYGKVSGKIKSSRGKGVVTAFILLSDVKDEIDYEWVGADLSLVQTNYYWQGVLDWHNSGNISVEGEDTYNDWHTYEIDWTPEKVDWIVDGSVQRTLKKADTYNETSKQYQFPQTPSRLQMSLWPAGQPSNAQGTIDWAGGEIDWNSEDIQKVGYDFATVGEVSVKCYDAPSDAKNHGDKSYLYANKAAMESDIETTNNSTVLGSLGATGLDMDLGASSSSSNTTSASNSIPTGKGGSGGMAANGTSETTGTSTSDDAASTTSSGFSQGTTTKDSGAAGQNERVLRGSLFGVLVALVVLVTL
ncbi:Glycoside hydrolase family 16 CRH1 predicted [Penicillium brevicompactum]|uniref:Crh-like protein n=1 Tax=Penicillium brevicompactum TaxID=5074 RepID=A0A9W9QHL8_PENBR|nr:Glycoside hydrolase family 16 CRH1 predicted [Penicillium brevicompactum]KAJ5327094.1 Glycoside hydrolase family 16 CRH1 predicted [Penicillium brevicompactum]KAJ5338100.1 Glycoside hydrolase family 16 CRH1 predicted [Penicillium brevicompactum]KAJ5340968.1 Glycoside hydrolase family 16 CRH1 predicted [Penicillium brevicompactum]